MLKGIVCMCLLNYINPEVPVKEISFEHTKSEYN